MVLRPRHKVIWDVSHCCGARLAAAPWPQAVNASSADWAAAVHGLGTGFPLCVERSWAQRGCNVPRRMSSYLTDESDFSQQVMGCESSLALSAKHAHTLSDQPRKQEQALGACLPGVQYDAPARKRGAIQCEGFILAALSAHVAAILPAVPSVLA